MGVVLVASKKVTDLLKQKKIYQILRPKCVNCLPDLTLQQALDLMRREKSGYIVVADEHMKVIGLFTERDVLMKVLRPGVGLNEPMKKYMNSDPPILSKKDTVGSVIETMNNCNVRHIPLVDELGQMTGVLSARTIINFLAELFPVEVFNLPPRADQIHHTVEGG